MLGLSVLIIYYLAERIRKDSKVNSTDFNWVYYVFEQRFLTLSGMHGFICLFVELIQTIKKKEVNSKKLAYHMIQK